MYSFEPIQCCVLGLGADVRRCKFITLIGGATVAFACSAVIGPGEAQTARRKRLGYLSGGGQGAGEFSIDILKASLRDLGWRGNETLDTET
jgi:hypothetical protein